jgi:uncharacterized SAM-binding protein YcdF (DUF218 family)
MQAYNSRAAISDFLFVEEAAVAVDLAFVCCSPNISNLMPALALYQTGLTPYILITGGNPSNEGVEEWRLYQDTALAKGVPQTALLIEKRATNTAENAAFGAALIEATLGWGAIQRMAVCAKPFHMRRALMTVRNHVPDSVEIFARPPNDPGDLARHNWWHTTWGRTRVLEELGKISQYALKGDLGDV